MICYESGYSATKAGVGKGWMVEAYLRICIERGVGHGHDAFAFQEPLKEDPFPSTRFLSFWTWEVVEMSLKNLPTLVSPFSLQQSFSWTLCHGYVLPQGEWLRRLLLLLFFLLLFLLLLLHILREDQGEEIWYVHLPHYCYLLLHPRRGMKETWATENVLLLFEHGMDWHLKKWLPWMEEVVVMWMEVVVGVGW